MHLQLLHESLSRFGESFASFLYGLNMNAFVVDFPEVNHIPLFVREISAEVYPQAPLAESIKRHQKQQRQRDMLDMSSTALHSGSTAARMTDGDTTTMTADGTFADSASMRATPRRRTMNAPVTPVAVPTNKSRIPPVAKDSSSGVGRGRGAGRGARGSGLPRGRGRGRG